MPRFIAIAGLLALGLSACTAGMTETGRDGAWSRGSTAIVTGGTVRGGGAGAE